MVFFFFFWLRVIGLSWSFLYFFFYGCVCFRSLSYCLFLLFFSFFLFNLLEASIVFQVFVTFPQSFFVFLPYKQKLQAIWNQRAFCRNESEKLKQN